MTGHVSAKPTPRALIDEVAASGRDVAQEFETMFGVLRSLRSELGSTGALVSGLRARDHAVHGHILEMSAKGVLDHLKQTVSATAECHGLKEDLDALTAVLDLPEPSPAPSPTILMRHTNRPVTRIASAMQARDQLDQRIAHIVDGFALIEEREIGPGHESSVVLTAQVQSISDSLLEIVETGRTEIEALSEALSKILEPVALVAADQAILTISDRLSGLFDNSPDQSGALKDLTDSLAIADEAPKGIDPELLTTKKTVLDKQLDELLDGFAMLGAKAERWGEVASELEARPGDGGKPDADTETLDLLKALYTCDIEHSVHAAVAQRP